MYVWVIQLTASNVRKILLIHPFTRTIIRVKFLYKLVRWYFVNSIELIILNLEEVRRRSIKVWSSIPKDFLHWKPDSEAMSCLEMIRHVLESEHYYHLAIKNKGSLTKFESPFEAQPLVSVEKELEFAKPFRQEFLNTIRLFNEEDLLNIEINRSDVGYVRKLGDMLLRIAYHEAVHTGQLLDYLRTAGVPRTNIWD
jgi:uncharacterized damage-inducible protein DinB